MPFMGLTGSRMGQPPSPMIQAIVQNIEFHINQPQANRRSIILLSTGGLNPVHRGHLSMLVRAAEGIEASIGTPGRVHADPERTPFAHIAAAVLSPSADCYLATKQQTPHFRGRDRAAMVKDSIQAAGEASWFFSDTWESDQADFVDFPAVRKALIQRIYEAIPPRLGIELINKGHAIEVVYVCGTDHADKCSLWTRDWVAVVGRGSASPERNPIARFVDGEEANLLTSSTRVREITKAYHDCEIDQEQFRTQLDPLVYPAVTEMLIKAVIPVPVVEVGG